jgi:U3 small nucleolar RNA-associated protein 13
MDGHIDKVWALDMSSDGNTFVSGGGDSRIVVWNDTTQEEDNMKRATEEQNILMEQKLANHLRYKEYEQALEIALQLEKPMQALKVLNSIVENDVQKGQSGFETLQRHVKGWSMARTTQILRYCRDWNTRARNCHMAMLVLKAIVSTIPAHTLAAAEGVPEILAGITPYAERHFDRLDRLHASTYLLDFALFSMGSLDTEQDDAKAFADWESKSKMVLPPKQDGRIQVGGTALVGRDTQGGAEDDDEVVTIGESDSSDDDDESSSSSVTPEEADVDMADKGEPDDKKRQGDSSSSSELDSDSP